VLERTLHSTLAGEGAFLFALEIGFAPTQLLMPHALEAWLTWRNDPNRKTFWIDKSHHDTIGLVAVDGKRHLVSGCSTSGLAWKLPGGVADPATVGSGVYADDRAGDRERRHHAVIWNRSPSQTEATCLASHLPGGATNRRPTPFVTSTACDLKVQGVELDRVKVSEDLGTNRSELLC
jgi:hypothetical protein